MNDRTILDRLLTGLVPGLKQHLSNATMAEFSGGRLSALDRWIVRQHLAKCWGCRGRLHYLKGPGAECILQEYSEATEFVASQPPERPRAVLAAWLEEYVSQEGERELHARPRAGGMRLRVAPRLLAVSLSLVVAISAGSFYFWPRPVALGVSADDLLNKAARWEHPDPNANAGFAYQKLEIKTNGSRLERSVYWDLHGKRLAKAVAPTGTTRQLKATLEQAGVNWDHPISAEDYLTWRGEQARREDSITRTGEHLLTLTTTMDTGAVLGQSLTMRDTDFHPVARTVDFRDREHVEIAELDYAVLPWNVPQASVFEPLGNADIVSTANARILPIFPLAAPSQEQLDEAELGVRLVLNQLHADIGEQITIHQSSQVVDVEGMVETEKQKNELRAQLATIPRVHVSIQSLDDVKRTREYGITPEQIEAVTMQDQASALQMFLESRGRDVKDSNLIAHRLFSTALTISQESEALAELQSRFRPNATSSMMMSATLADLIYSHQERLEDVLKQERHLLAEIGAADAMGEESSRHPVSLSEAAARNLALTKELTRTDLPPERKAAAICTDLSAAADRIDMAAQSVNGVLQENAVTSGKD
ncbi:hypothetical protein [Acidicapsa ligni]|uniref:hypothetical protein n=1 Tax=Acidicapsa ligni TaxID=542300 RepID=UPI0021E06A53|nr:hypothetical protein [Acidicapsa ligni]